MLALDGIAERWLTENSCNEPVEPDPISIGVGMSELSMIGCEIRGNSLLVSLCY